MNRKTVQEAAFSLLLTILSAAGGCALEVVPGALALRDVPRKTMRGDFTVTNDTARDLEVTAETSDFAGFDGPAGAEIKLSPGKFRLKPGAARKLLRARFAGAVDREKALRVSFLAREPRSAWLTTVLSQAVYFVPATSDVKVSLDSFTLDEKSPGHWDALVRVSNRGTVHLISNASFTVREEGKASMHLRGSELKVLAPGAQDSFSCSWEPSAPAGAMSAMVAIHYRPPFGGAGELDGVAPGRGVK